MIKDPLYVLRHPPVYEGGEGIDPAVLYAFVRLYIDHKKDILVLLLLDNIEQIYRATYLL